MRKNTEKGPTETGTEKRKKKEPAEEHTHDENALTSRFRGVCWNKKNKRWQAALNTQGKYIYLGSFIEEEEAARMFDKASIVVRGDKAKPNWPLREYQDAQGKLIEDPIVMAMVSKGAAKGGEEGERKKRGGPSSDLKEEAEGQEEFKAKKQRTTNEPVQGPFDGSIFGNGIDIGDLTALANTLAVATWPHTIAKGPLKKMSPLDLPLPKGCSLESTIPCVAPGSGPSTSTPSIQEIVFGVTYSGRAPSRSPRASAAGSEKKMGAMVWDGATTHDLGLYSTERDARQACTSCLVLVLHYLQPPPPQPGSTLLPPIPPWPASKSDRRTEQSNVQPANPPTSGDAALGLSNGLLQAGSLSLDKAGSINAALQHLLFGAGSLALARSSSFPDPHASSLGALLGPLGSSEGGNEGVPPASKGAAPSYGDLFSFLQAVPAPVVNVEKAPAAPAAEELEGGRGGFRQIKALSNVSVAELKKMKGKAR